MAAFAVAEFAFVPVVADCADTTLGNAADPRTAAPVIFRKLRRLLLVDFEDSALFMNALVEPG
jgi:hypothetical protein